MTPELRRTNVFVSYSHKDKFWRGRLEVHVKSLVRNGIITFWDDTGINAGDDWRADIERAIQSARIAVLLISADFLASDFISTEEVPKLLRAVEDGLVILPILVSPYFEISPWLSRFQFVNKDTALVKMDKGRREEVLAAAASAIYQRVESAQSRGFAAAEAGATVDLATPGATVERSRTFPSEGVEGEPSERVQDDILREPANTASRPGAVSSPEVASIVRIPGTAAAIQPEWTTSLEHRTTRTAAKGSPFPLGATPVADGVNFALYSKSADEIFLLLFDTPDAPPTDIIRLEHRHRSIWHVRIKGLKAGQLYAYKARGEYRPAWGLYFNDSKLLLDPYAKAVTGKFRNADNLLLAHDARFEGGDRPDTRDNTAVVPKAVVVDDGAFDWQGVTSPSRGIEELIIYEVHVKGFTAGSSSRVSLPGTYLGFIGKIPYLTQLGVNAVELLPIHEHYVLDFLSERGLTDYWGYNSIGFFAPEWSYSSQHAPGCQVHEFKTLVRELHRAGIQVILDVVYNHTGEGNEAGPNISFRGLDNPSYYSLTGPPEAPRRFYLNYSGAGNSLNFDSPVVLRLVMDSMRYWVEVMHVDGFRFDLAAVLGRSEDGGFSSSASFFDAVSQDPVLSRAIMIAEPWDIGTYQVGNFPAEWSEWNGRFRDTVRRFARGDPGQLADLAWRLTGSADLYGDDGRSAYNSVNFVTCHDGFTLHDLVSYNSKRNEDNGENNQDGANDNNSWNCGVEGETADPAICALRKQILKNHACYLLFACGIPMIQGGDEFARTQRGNNNAYCQDNEISWYDWTLASRNRDLVEFFRKAIAFKRRFPVLQSPELLLRKNLDADGVSVVKWFGPDLGQPAWSDANARTLCYELDTCGAGAATDADRLFFILNGDSGSQWVRLPPPGTSHGWYRAIDTSLRTGEDFMDAGQEVLIVPADHYVANPRSMVVLLAH